ncbi:endonuclease/exonuclease/phosphatase family protein [Rheinheimera metallidurans]|uniref:endonuclease/exonuclease/phosphatase family protein n=1 Tax=Rheinheimera metallidurans TaxID=2925781 RepID=UPI003002C6A3
MLLILTFFTLFLLLATLLPLSRQTHWFIRGFDFPRLQFALLAIVVLISSVIVLDLHMLLSQALIVTCALCLAWQLWWILPYTLLWPKEVKAAGHTDVSKQLTILTSNVLTPNRNAGALIALVKQYQPDVLVTLESDQWWEDELTVLESEMPYSVKCPLDNLYGMHVFSRLPLTEREVCYFIEDDVPSIDVLVELRCKETVRMHCLHPAPPSPTENAESAERDAELVIVAQSIADTEQPVIVTGDLNDVAWSATTRLFRKISGLLDPRVGRGMFNTFHADYPFVRWPLDHLFHSRHFTLQAIQRLPSIGSDHFPLLTTLCFTPKKGASQQAIQADRSEHEWAKQISGSKQVNKHDVPKPGA